MKLRNNIPILLVLISLGLPGRALGVGTWTALTHKPQANITLCLLLSDGTVLAQGLGNNWYKLTPDSGGHYANGTWSNRQSSTWSHLNGSTAVLQNGNVFVAGGENGDAYNTVEIYNPTNDTWTVAVDPTFFGSIEDGNAMLLSNGQVLIEPQEASGKYSGMTFTFNPADNKFTQTAGAPLNGIGEATWVKLPNDNILVIDSGNSGTGATTAEQYDPSTGTWGNAQSGVPNIWPDVSATGYVSEMGPAFLLPNGNAIFFGGNGATAVYNNGTWSQSATLPNGLAMKDAGGAMMVNGKILLAVCSPGNNDIPNYINGDGPTSFYEYDYTAKGGAGDYALAPTPVPVDDFSLSAASVCFLALPDGTILCSNFEGQLWVYQPDGTPLAAGQPTIGNISLNGDGSLHLVGTLFNGISQGASYGDDAQMDSNYPLVRFTDANGIVRYGRTYNWSSTSVQTGSALVSTECALPTGASLNDFIQVVANGNASAPAYGLAVVTTNSDSGPGSLRGIMASLPPDSTVTFATNLDDSTITLTSGELLLTNDVTIDASALPDGITIDGNHAGRVFEVAAGVTAVMNSLTLINGDAGNANGGGILNNGSLTLNGCTLSGNNATNGTGGGIFNPGGTLALNQCTLAGNSTSGNGGAVRVGSGTVVTLNSCTLSGNTAGNFGGGLHNNGGTVLVTNSIIAGNTQSGGGPDISGGFSGQNNLTNGVPLLASLGNYGGPTPTMPPLPGSPAIEAGNNVAASAFATDQRGLPRLASTQVDIGAVELQTPFLVVTNGADSGPGSLRQLVSQVDVSATLTFDGSVSGQTLVLSSGQITLTNNLIIDASSLSNGIYLYGNDSSRIFLVGSGLNVTLNSLNLSGGNAGGGNGGGILNNGNLTLNECTLTGNNATNGSGGGIYTSAALTLNQCTLAANSAPGSGNGGGLYLFGGTMALNSCTLSGNSAGTKGGGIFNNGGTVTMTNSIVAGNTANSGSNISGGFTGQNNLTSGDPLLAAPGYYGGIAATLPPLPGSPAIDAGNNAAASAFATDERGLPRLAGAQVDIGAVELQTPFLVVSNKTDSNPGSLRQVLDQVDVSATITFDGSLSGKTITLTNGQLTLTDNLIIDASSLPKGIQLNGNAGSRLLLVNSGANATLNALTFTNGASSNGGGIRNNGNLTLNECTLAGNSAPSGTGGGLYNSSGTLTLNQCTLAGNTAAGNGGGISCTSGGTLAVNQCTVSGNAAGSNGGGIYNNGGTVLVTNCVVAGNTQASGTDLSGGFTGQNNLTNGTPLLAALGNYGGPTPTMPPLPGSPAIDAGSDTAASAFATDQRGFPRIAGAHVDIGAVELPVSPVVLNTADSGYGSLRDAATYLTNSPTITFAGSLSGQAITLTSGFITLNNNLTIDGSMLPNGIQLNGNASSRLFLVNPGVIATLDSLTLTNGVNSNGGGIRNNGTLTLNECTLAGNAATSGNGGGIYNPGGTLTLNQCTLAGNSASGDGGGISCSSGGTVAVNQSTLSGNSAPNGIGGGIYNTGSTVTVTNSIVAGNTETSGADISGTFTGQNNLTNGVPQLAALGNYGGATPTMPPLTGSPAIDAGSDTATNSFAFDQRGPGFPRLSGAHVDIGAVEVQTAVTIPPPLLAGLTWLGNGGFGFSFTNLTGTGFTVFGSTNVALPFTQWLNLGPASETPAGSGHFQFTDPQATNNARRFYRVRAP